MTGPSAENRGRLDVRSAPGHRRQLSQEVADYLRDAIMAAQLASGEFVRPERIASELEMSATPVREALVTLEREGFLIWEPRRGFRVSKISSQDVQDMFNVQAFIAGELAARAADRLTDSDLGELGVLQENLERASLANDVDAVEEYNHNFHRIINQAGDSPGLARLLSLVVSYVPDRFFGSVAGWTQASVVDHAEILRALRNRDLEGARLAVVMHIRHAGSLLGDHFQPRDQAASTDLPLSRFPTRVSPRTGTP
jgi:DNA-binding GntR family transcriptional regulator